MRKKALTRELRVIHAWNRCERGLSSAIEFSGKAEGGSARGMKKTEKKQKGRIQWNHRGKERKGEGREVTGVNGIIKQRREGET